MGTATTLIDALEVVSGGIVKNTPISSRFDAALLSSHIKTAELRFLKPVLCEDFYLDLIAQKENVSNYNENICPAAEAYPSNALYESLWKEYLLPYLSHCVLYEALPFVAVQIGSNGLFENSIEFGTNTGLEGVKFIQDTLMTKINILKKDLLDYLCENQAQFPLFCNDCHCKESEECNDCSGTDSNSNDLGIIFY